MWWLGPRLEALAGQADALSAELDAPTQQRTVDSETPALPSVVTSAPLIDALLTDLRQKAAFSVRSVSAAGPLGGQPQLARLLSLKSPSNP